MPVFVKGYHRVSKSGKAVNVRSYASSKRRLLGAITSGKLNSSAIHNTGVAYGQLKREQAASVIGRLSSKARGASKGRIKTLIRRYNKVKRFV